MTTTDKTGPDPQHLPIPQQTETHTDKTQLSPQTQTLSARTTTCGATAPNNADKGYHIADSTNHMDTQLRTAE